jgi:hypothetical protein
MVLVQFIWGYYFYLFILLISQQKQIHEIAGIPQLRSLYIYCIYNVFLGEGHYQIEKIRIPKESPTRQN